LLYFNKIHTIDEKLLDMNMHCHTIKCKDMKLKIFAQHSKMIELVIHHCSDSPSSGKEKKTMRCLDIEAQSVITTSIKCD
jgi:hypothetical protein